MARTYWVTPAIPAGTPGPRPITGCQSPEEAVSVYVEQLVSTVDPGWQAGRFTVSVMGKGSEQRRFDASVAWTPYVGDDAEEGELECEVAVFEIDERDGQDDG